MAWTAAKDLPAVADEIAHLTGGISYWRFGENHLQPENGFIAMHWATIPLLFHPPSFPPVPGDVPQGSAMIVVGNRFFYDSGNDPAWMLAKGRAMASLVGAGLIAMIWWWSRRLWGVRGGLLAAGLAAFCPTLLAQGGIVMSDVTVAFFLLVTLTIYWTLLNRFSTFRVGLCGLCLGALLLSKISGVVVFPMMVALALVRLWSRIQLAARPDCPAQKRLAAEFARIVGGSLAAGLIAGTVLWAAFGFHFTMFANPTAPAPHFDVTWDVLLRDPGFALKIAGELRKLHALPEAWLYGFAQTIHFLPGRPTFLNGNFSTEAQLSYFPYAYLFKTPLTLFLLMILGWAGARSLHAAPPRSSQAAAAGGTRSLVYEAAPLFVLFVGYWILALLSQINIGQRHLLPIYAPMLILAGGSVHAARRGGRRIQIAVATLTLLFAAESLWIRPHYLAYFNFLAGGPAGGYRHLLDSNVDVGQDLIELRRWLDQNAALGTPQAPPIFLSFFGPADPVAHGIQVTRFADNGFDARPRDMPAKVTGGVFCISVTLSQGLYTAAPGLWTKEREDLYQKLVTQAARQTPTFNEAVLLEHLQFGRLRFFLTGRSPDARVGYTILIFKLTNQEVEEALYAPLAIVAQSVVQRLPKP